ncbi:MAG: ROK family protein [Balneolales bacterium]
MQAAGIDLGGTKIKAALVDRERGILEQFSVPTEAEKGKDHILKRLAEAIEKIKGLTDKKLQGVGIGSPGVISLDRTTVTYPPNLPGWTKVNVAQEIKERTDLTAYVENDANLAALGSSRFGQGRAYDSFIMLTLGTGVGGGIIFRKELFRGSTGGAAELGHVIIDYNGLSSNSRTKGGIEAYLGQRFLSRIAAEAIRKEPENALYKRFHERYEQLDPFEINIEADKGNELAIRILRDAGQKLGYAIVNYVHILDIRTVILSGGVAKAGKWLIEPARSSAIERMMPSYHEGFDIIYENLGNDAALLGASSLAFENLRG